jgi:hypothetical protein
MVVLRASSHLASATDGDMLESAEESARARNRGRAADGPRRPTQVVRSSAGHERRSVPHRRAVELNGAGLAQLRYPYDAERSHVRRRIQVQGEIAAGGSILRDLHHLARGHGELALRVREIGDVGNDTVGLPGRGVGSDSRYPFAQTKRRTRRPSMDGARVRAAEIFARVRSPSGAWAP